jgi:DNA gyrase subunit A
MPPRASPKSPALPDGIEDEDLIEREDMVVTVTMDGYIKRTPLSTFRAQNRGGKGRAGMATKEEDAVTEMFVTSDPQSGAVLLDRRQGLSPQGLETARRRPDHARAADRQPAARARQGRDHRHRSALPEDEANGASCSVVFATAKGNVRRNSMDAFANIPSNGKFAMRFEEGSSKTA